MERHKRYIILLILVNVVVQMLAQWTNQKYNEYTYATYTSYSAFNQSITDTDYNNDLLEAALFYETNRQRAKYGLSQLTHDYNLEVCAHNHSVDMVRNDFFSHQSPIAGKTMMSDRLALVGYKNCAAAENIAYHTIGDSYAETARIIVDMWMNSPGHRANILNANYTHLGCGVAFYAKDSFIYVKATQNFVMKSRRS